MERDPHSGRLTQDDLEPLLRGMEILGTGGGGSAEFGRAIMENDFERGRAYRLIDVDSLADDALVASGGIMGSVKALDAFSPREIVQNWEARFEPMAALRAMERYLGRSIDAIVPFELGGLNTPVILSLGARVGVPVIDGDGVGRAAPETQMTSFLGHGVPVTPMPLVDWRGNTVIVSDAATPFFPDEVGRFVISAAGGLGANAHYPMSGAQAKRAVVTASITFARDLGRSLAGIEDAERAIPVLAERLSGRHVFSGRISAIHEQEAAGFLVQTAEAVGIDEYRDRRLQIVMKNEFMMASLDGRVGCIFPDLILILDERGHGVMSSEMTVGQVIRVVIGPCHERVREAVLDEIGRSAFGPSRFGQPDVEYQPVEQLGSVWGVSW